MSAAAYLSKAGHEVVVVEKNKLPGGRAQVMKKKGFTFDLGPSWYLMPDVFEDFFTDFDSSVHEHYKLEQVLPSYRVFTHETDYDVSTWPEIGELFDALDPGAGERLGKLLKKTEREYHDVRGGLLELDGLTKSQFLNPKALKMLLKPGMRKPYHHRIAKVTNNADLQHILEFMTVFMGGSPLSIPALYSLLSYVDMGLGVWYPMGGFGSVVKAFEKTAKKQGAAFRYGAPVSKIITTGHKVTGVQVGEEIITCDVVVANADYHFVETQLLESKDQTYHEKYWEKRTLSPSAVIASIGVKRLIPELRHHNLLFDTNWDTHFSQVFDSKEWSTKPLVYVSNPSKTDPKVAPKGMENLFILAPMAAGIDPSDEQLERVVLSIIGRLQEQVGYEFMNDIVVADIKAEDYFEETFNAFKGNAFGLGHTMSQSGPNRPRMQSKKLSNLYYVGQYTNPGTGVPMVVTSGKVVSRLINEK